MTKVGVLALQGGYAAHCKALVAAGCDPVEVRTAKGLDGLDGLVFPGGESTTQRKLMAANGMTDAVNAFVQSGAPVLLTCAGVVLAASKVDGESQSGTGWLDIAVARNAWGRQVHSFEAVSDCGRWPLVFIRAPRIVEMGPRVQVLATYREEPVLVRQGRVVGATFHPELTDCIELHRQVFVGGGELAGEPASVDVA